MKKLVILVMPAVLPSVMMAQTSENTSQSVIKKQPIPTVTIPSQLGSTGFGMSQITKPTNDNAPVSRPMSASACNSNLFVFTDFLRGQATSMPLGFYLSSDRQTA
ncbi:hypothetical protein [Paludibacter jiangxiensis]|uniref:Uncharacterized protein n=1 Tax=Paludibacter jiangxiensis TaxID=681398 RepID=A0A171A9B6_9BACT|nr:hypothetical protein [Paludibacter jiangxiensis]GAT63413.1 hypothetical protein PJIAN_3742 [Paludibacter jiangxiensis]